MSIGGDPDLTIRLNLDNSAAVQASSAFIAASRKAEDAARQFAQTQEQEARRAARSGGDESERQFARQRDAFGRFVRQGTEGYDQIRHASEQSARGQAEGFSLVQAGASGIASTVQSLATQFLALAAPAAVFKTIAESAHAAADSIRAVTAETLKARDAQREIAALKGFEGPNDEVLRRTIDFRLQTGLTADEADRFEKQFEGSLPIGIELGNITRQVADQLKIAAAQKVSRIGGDAGVAGDIAGVLGQFGKISSARQGLGQLEAVRRALTAGRGDDPVLTAQLLQVAGSQVREGGAIGTLPELAALVGVTSLSAGPQAAGTRVEQFTRFVRRLQAGKRPGRGSGAASALDKFGKQAGVAEGQSLEQSIAGIAGVLQQQEAQGRDLDVYLTQQGAASEEERRAVIEIYRNRQALTQRFAQARKDSSLVSGAKVEQEAAEFFKTALGRSKVAEVQVDAARLSRGALPGREVFAGLVRQEEAKQIAGGADESVGTQFGDRVRGALVGSFFNAERGRQARLEHAVLSRLNEQLDKAGLRQEFESGLSFSEGLSPVQYGARQAAFLQQRGIDPGGSPEAVTGALDAAFGKIDPNPHLSVLVDLQREQNEILRQGRGAAAPPSGRPRVAPPAPGTVR